MIAVGAVLVAGVGAWQLYATMWTLHAEHAGQSLIHGFLQRHALATPVGPSSREAGTTALAACTIGAKGGAAHRHPSVRQATAVHGLLEIPALGVVAPVEQGMGDAQLAVAVGHNPDSVWPGQRGNAVLYAHDVSYFTSIPSLKNGDEVTFVTPCTTYTFAVTSHAIVKQGAPLYNTSTAAVTLVTCWPTDALWFTPDRYLVTATEIAQRATGPGAHSYAKASKPPSVPVPAPLAAQGVTLGTYDLPMGTFSLRGDPNRSWAQSTGPLLVEGSAVEAFIAGVRSLAEGRLDWWAKIAPGVPPPSPLVDAGTPWYESPTDVTEQTVRTEVVSITITDTVTVTGGNEPGRYAVTVHEAVVGHTLTVTSWAMQAA